MPTKQDVIRNGAWVERDTLTVAEARQILEGAQARGLSGQSKVNKSLTRQQAFEIFSRAIQGKDDLEPVNFMTAKNIQREFS